MVRPAVGPRCDTSRSLRLSVAPVAHMRSQAPTRKGTTLRLAADLPRHVASENTWQSIVTVLDREAASAALAGPDSIQRAGKHPTS